MVGVQQSFQVYPSNSYTMGFSDITPGNQTCEVVRFRRNILSGSNIHVLYITQRMKQNLVTHKGTEKRHSF